MMPVRAQCRRRRRLLPKPPEPPPGYMLWHQRLMRIEQVEAIARAAMKGFDKLPRERRDEINGDHRLHRSRGSGA